MKSIFKCELSYFPSPHLSQIYDGFETLRKQGIVDVMLSPQKKDPAMPILHVKVNDKFDIVYDTLDGLNWVDADLEGNMNYFNEQVQADYYFKRSFNPILQYHAPRNCKVFPLGLNCHFIAKGKFPKSVKETIKDAIKENFIVERLHKKTNFNCNAFEFYPFRANENKILFYTRLWDPSLNDSIAIKRDRAQVNQDRINYIRTCRKEFGPLFNGGLEANPIALKTAKDLVMNPKVHTRSHFINKMRESNICLTSTGLFKSTGWKFGEYVAGARAIVSEPLHFELPGDFAVEKNYLSFQNTDELITSIQRLMEDKDLQFNIMNNNFQYYNNYVRPDKLVFNTLLKVYEDHLHIL